MTSLGHSAASLAIGCAFASAMSGCVGWTQPEVVERVAQVTIGGRSYLVRAMPAQVWTLATDPESGATVPVQMDRIAPTVMVEGAPDGATALRAAGLFCGKGRDLSAWAEDYHYRDPATGTWWIADMC
ncbi:hypothetical protein [Neotabrizicola shimadae]|uniref:Lipoprotein n=1 Tax=Neotabrizicola shimadae TaxID=2807096 RepID=A0A8G0ZY28_9RHOB|nr:hypothetical protein [Neotabrizicola shimadae]QYZ71031.1 hypothetical protein JO391_05840 [Neotabrizicola shimadae]